LARRISEGVKMFGLIFCEQKDCANKATVSGADYTEIGQKLFELGWRKDGCPSHVVDFQQMEFEE
jgi:hypothetical protein